MPRIDGAAQPSNDGERLAINLFDLDRVDPLIRDMLLGGKLDLNRNSIVRADKDRMDETGVPFICDLLTAACICDTLRSHDRAAGDHPTRVYLFKKTWQKLPGHAVLTRVVDGKPVLDYEWFRPVATVNEPLATGRVL